MKELLRLAGGYKRVMDYVLNLQSENLTLGNSLFSALGVDLVLSGCAITNNNNGTINIADGLIYISGDAVRFDGANNIASNGSKTFVKGGYVTSDQKEFGDGSQKNVYREAKAAIVNSTDGNQRQIKITTTLYDLKQYIRDVVANSDVKGAYKEIYDFDGTFRPNFDESGLGVTPRWYGWAIDNGENGTPGTSGMALIAAGTYTDPVSGEETVYEMGQNVGERLHKLSQSESATPTGTVPGLVGPRGKPGDGGGGPVYYVSGPLKAGADAQVGHNNMQPSKAVYRVIKIVD
ncbi:hypothetical protein [Mucilaginibacter sp. 5C4]|uniref:hypothetical protein n=1 Tax=Mucilaginibacter sp. 5C4 TaxID=3048589 RepID=UPI002AC9DF41|nr:hypothetical protein [Mucilaginibacter sp. 5C4]MEB0302402.1 hypothetical protein [Mucilaginibacter sp. 5C4]WPX22968.1 hypothetical protein RHM67_16935 [Mucilaginibacter sp. 5C4]